MRRNRVTRFRKTSWFGLRSWCRKGRCCRSPILICAGTRGSIRPRSRTSATSRNRSGRRPATRATRWRTPNRRRTEASCTNHQEPPPMWIVRIALDRPYTFVVLALLILILSPLVILATPTDIFPNINIPVVAVGWTYTGLNPEEMEGRITTVYERSLTTLVDNIQHIESTSYDGLAIVKIY